MVPLRVGSSTAYLAVPSDMEAVSTFPGGGFGTSGLLGAAMRAALLGPGWRLEASRS